MNWFVDGFVPGRSERERRDPDVSPLYADLQGLPPALFSCGTFDPLLDDSLFMSARWQQAGNETVLVALAGRRARLHGVPDRDRPPLSCRADRLSYAASSRSPARTGTASRLPGGASGQTQRGSYEHDGL